MPKFKLTKEQKAELKSIVDQMPIFPHTDENGKPTVQYGIFRGSYLRNNYGDMIKRGYSMFSKKDILPNEQYKVPGLLPRDNEAVAIKAMKEGKVAELIRDHYAKYERYLKYIQTYGDKLDNTKSTK